MAPRKTPGGKHSPKNPKNAKDKGLGSDRGSKGTRKGTQKVVPPKTSEEAFE